jgi:hypothetical protein
LLSKKNLFYTSILFLTLFLFSGCIATNLIQNAKVVGLAHHYPVNITDQKQKSKPIINTQIIYNNQSTTKLNTGEYPKVNREGKFVVIPVENQSWFKVDSNANIYDFNDTNITWKKPNTEIQGNIDIPLSKHISFLFGVSFGTINSEIFWGNRIGLNLSWEYNNWAWNLESYYNNYSKKYDVDYITWDDSRFVVDYDRVWFGSGSGHDRFYDLSIFTTINSTVSSWPMNIFFRIGIGSI